MINACLFIGAVSILLNQSNQYVSSSSGGQPPTRSFASEKNRREARQFLQINKSSQPFAISNGSAPSSGSPIGALAGPTYEQLELATQSELELAQLLVFRFHDLFENKQQQQELNQTICCAGAAIDTTSNGLVQAALETRKIDTNTATGAVSSTATVTTTTAAAAASARKELNDRSYFKILNRVFSRVELPDLYKGSRNPPSRGLHCGPHIGCIEEIPNFPSLLKRPNISSSFTIYTPTSPRSGRRILFEPILHHQLQDGADSQQPPLSSNIDELPSAATVDKRPADTRPHLTAASWRSASRVVASQEYPFDLAALEQSGFDAALNTRIIVGGYFAKEDEEWIDEIVRQWTLLEPMSNIVKVSWPDANRGLYHTAAYNSRIVGRQLTLFLHYLDQLFHIDLGRFHLVGHSLGAHIAGFAGADNEGRIARITGLDPAGPIFVELNTSMRLDPSDAQFVDVMHTNGGSITKGALGLSIPSGHVDYYCNGGSIQPGCYFSSVTKSMMDPVERVACSHRRSYRYFTELIRLAISENALVNSPQATSGGSSDEEAVAQPLAAFASDNITTSGDLYPASIYDTNVLARRLHHADQDELTASQTTTTTTKPRKLSGKFPRAFLFEAKQEDLVRLSQPEILMMSRNSALRREMAHSGDSQQLAPLKRHLEFHEMKPDFPAGKRGLYLFKTRSESPFFASKQYALTLRTDGPIRRKIILMARVEQTLVAEVEADEIPGLYTIAFAPNDPKLFHNLDPNSNLHHTHSFNSTSTNNFASKSWPLAPKIPQVSLMWRFRSFNLLLNQQNELPLVGLELSLLDADGDQAPVLVKYAPPATSHSLQAAVFRGISGASAGSLGSSMAAAAAGSQHMSLVRNQWHRFEGKLLARPAA